MTYVVDERCIKCKTTDCVAVCPVDCFYEGENMLVINPEECIDCSVCVPECPADAIKADSEPGMEKWLELNREYSKKWPHHEQEGDGNSKNTFHPTPVQATNLAFAFQRPVRNGLLSDRADMLARQAKRKVGPADQQRAEDDGCDESRDHAVVADEHDKEVRDKGGDEDEHALTHDHRPIDGTPVHHSSPSTSVAARASGWATSVRAGGVGFVRKAIT